MSIDLKNISKSTPKKPRIIAYGLPGIGKTTFAANADKPIFIMVEDGLGELDVPAIPLNEDGKPRVAASYNEVMECLSELGQQEHDFKTVVIDTIDALETLVWEATCQRLNVKSIEEPGYGRGYVEALTEWKMFFDMLTALRDHKQMTIVMIAHDSVVKVEDPMHPAYDMHTIKIHKRAAAKAIEYADIVGFASYKTLVTTEKTGFNQTRNRALDTGERVMHLSGTSAFIAKNRFSMPEVIPLVWTEFQKHLPEGGK
jgi:hypothetical protein